MERTIKIKNKFIGGKHPALIVAELSANHCQDFNLAARTIRAMKKAGADAVKVQTYTPDTMTIDCRNKYFKIRQGTPWDGKTLYELYKQAYTPWQWQPKLKKIAEGLGLIFFSTPFDKGSVDFLERLGVPAYKIASFEITDIPLIKYAAAKQKPIFISTGIARRSEIREAVAACRRVRNNRIVLLKCTSAYPAGPEACNLRMIPELKRDFKCLTGFSDHSRGITASVVAAALGAKVIERHFILDRKLGGPDAAFSLEPEEFKAMVGKIRQAEKMLGRISYSLPKGTAQMRDFSRSLFAVEDMRPGERFTEQNVRIIRPGFGLAPKYLSAVLGKKARGSVKRGTPLDWGYISKSRQD